MGLGPASHGEGRRKRLASYLLACWKPPSRSARQRKALCPSSWGGWERRCAPSSWEKGAVPRPRETAAPFQAIGFAVYAKGPRYPRLHVLLLPPEPPCSQCPLNVYLGDFRISVLPTALVSFSNKPQVQRDAGILTPSGDGQQQAHVRNGHLEKRHAQSCDGIQVWEAIKPFGAKVLHNEDNTCLGVNPIDYNYIL